MPHMAVFASMLNAPAMVAVAVMMRVSRFCTWANSCAITPESSCRFRERSSPSVTATAA